MPQQFRKKPVVIEAEQYTHPGQQLAGFCAHPRCEAGHGAKKPHVHTAHAGQAVYIEFGDWIIPEPGGRGYYPCKPDIFEATYEPESAPATGPRCDIQAAVERVVDELREDENYYFGWQSNIAMSFVDECGIDPLEANKGAKRMPSGRRRL